mmetsp:Transcript_546/g.1112  ORF Transcript_546/g.1112 Transcript_546/m.1112 type:complete len:265 (+) Transcript_546:108-902(+)
MAMHMYDVVTPPCTLSVSSGSLSGSPRCKSPTCASPLFQFTADYDVECRGLNVEESSSASRRLSRRAPPSARVSASTLVLVLVICIVKPSVLVAHLEVTHPGLDVRRLEHRIVPVEHCQLRRRRSGQQRLRIQQPVHPIEPVQTLHPVLLALIVVVIVIVVIVGVEGRAGGEGIKKPIQCCVESSHALHVQWHEAHLLSLGITIVVIVVVGLFLFLARQPSGRSTITHIHGSCTIGCCVIGLSCAVGKSYAVSSRRKLDPVLTV